MSASTTKVVSITFSFISVLICVFTVADQVMSRPRKIRKSVFQMSVLNEGEGEGKMEEEGEGEEGEWYSASETEENDSDCKLNQIEVGNVPRNVSEKVLKRYFETAKANSCDKAVSECVKLREGCFIVTFHDPEGKCLCIYH